MKLVDLLYWHIFEPNKLMYQKEFTQVDLYFKIFFWVGIGAVLLAQLIVLIGDDLDKMEYSPGVVLIILAWMLAKFVVWIFIANLTFIPAVVLGLVVIFLGSVLEIEILEDNLVPLSISLKNRQGAIREHREQYRQIINQ